MQHFLRLGLGCLRRWFAPFHQSLLQLHPGGLLLFNYFKNEHLSGRRSPTHDLSEELLCTLLVAWALARS
jgi:hypothetical protein